MKSVSKRPRFRTWFNLLCLEGAFAIAYETLLGPTYISGLAGELGVAVHWVTLLISVPWIGSIGQLAGVWAYERFPSVKKYTLLAATIARALWLIPLASAAFWGWRHQEAGTAFPTLQWFTILAITAGVSALFASSSSVVWMSWMRGLLPSNFRGRFFGVRQSYVMIALTIANLIAFSWVSWKPGGYYVGYGLIGFSALVCATISTSLLAKIPDVRHQRRHPTLQNIERTALKAILEPFQNAEFRPILIYGALFNGVIQLAGPYFPYYFTKELQIPMSTVALWSVVANLGYFVSAGIWGKRVDHSLHPRSVLWLSCHLISISPLFYVLPSAELTRWIAPVDFFISGVAWAGFFMAMTALVFRVAPQNKNAIYFSVYSAVVGLSSATFTWLGGRTVEWLSELGGFRSLWGIGTAARLLVIWLFAASPIFKEIKGYSLRNLSHS